MGIRPKMSIIALLEFELTYYDVAVQHVCHYATGNIHLDQVSLNTNTTIRNILSLIFLPFIRLS